MTGQVKTILVTPSAVATANPTLGQGPSVQRGSGLSKGTVVGIVIGSALAVGLAVSCLVWFLLRRRHARSSGDRSSSTWGPGTFARDSHLDPSKDLPSRQVSQMSSAGLLASGKSPRIQTTGLGGSNHGRSPDSTLPSPGDRRSVGTDQRLNPYALYAHDDSRNSNISLQDNQDYSRQLRVCPFRYALDQPTNHQLLRSPILTLEQNSTNASIHTLASGPTLLINNCAAQTHSLTCIFRHGYQKYGIQGLLNSIDAGGRVGCSVLVRGCREEPFPNSQQQRCA